MRIHRNLHNARKGGPQWVETEKGRVKQYLPAVLLTNVTTRIQPAGARKCAESGVRSVCAYFDGSEPASAYLGMGEWFKVAYDPRVHSAFLYEDRRYHPEFLRWNAADAARLTEDGACYVLNPRWEA